MTGNMYVCHRSGDGRYVNVKEVNRTAKPRLSGKMQEKHAQEVDHIACQGRRNLRNATRQTKTDPTKEEEYGACSEEF
jgi:hypothetical protein